MKIFLLASITTLPPEAGGHGQAFCQTAKIVGHKQPKEENSVLSYHKMTEEEKYVVCDWTYDGEYSIYNNPPYEEQLRKHQGFANTKNNFYSFLDGDTFVGYINLAEEPTEVFFGIGINPACCNQGYGQQLTKTARKLSRLLFPGKSIYLEVRTWNIRAVRCYEKAGFRIIGEPIVQTTRIGEGTFYRMTAEP